MSSSARRGVRRFCVGAINGAGITAPFAQSAADDVDESNNPPNLAASLNSQKYYTPSVFGASAYTNDCLLRSTVLVRPNRLIGVPQIFRATVPINTRPDPVGVPRFIIFAGLNMTFGE
jgi:hypothetical protein